MPYRISQKKPFPTTRQNYVPLLRNGITKNKNYKYCKVISVLSKNNSITILKQHGEKKRKRERERGVILMNCEKYLDKRCTILNANQT